MVETDCSQNSRAFWRRGKRRPTILTIHVIRSIEALAKRDVTTDKLNVKSGSYKLLVCRKVMGRGGGQWTGVVDKNVKVFMTGFDLPEGFLDGLVTSEIDLDQLNSVGDIRTFLLQGLNRKLAFLQRTAAEKNVIGFLR